MAYSRCRSGVASDQICRGVLILKPNPQGSCAQIVYMCVCVCAYVCIYIYI